MNRRIKHGFIFLTASLMAIGGGIAPANASPNNSQKIDPSACTRLAALEGDCITYVRVGDEDPMLAGIKQSLILNGVDGGAAKFIQKRKKTHPIDGTQLAAEEMLTAVKSLRDKTSRSAALGEMDTKQQRMSSSTGPQSRNPGGLGNIEGQTLRLWEIIDYGECEPGVGCGVVGLLDVEFRMTIENNLEFTLGGDLDVRWGWPVTFESIECQTVWDGLFNLDQVVHTWSTCPSAAYPHTPRTSATLLGEHWSGGGLGETYHPEYALSFSWQGSPPFYGEFFGKEYKIAQSGLTYWLP